MARAGMVGGPSPLFLSSLPPAAGSCGRCQKAYQGWQRGWRLTVKADDLIDVHTVRPIGSKA